MSAAVNPLVSIVVPAFNEAAIVEANLARICDYMETLAGRYRYELIVVDDGSTDGTGELARAFAERRPNVRVLSHPMNFSLGQALRYGFSQALGDYIVTLDLDLTYSPDHVERLLERLRTTRARIVLASPYMRGGRASNVPFLRLLLSRWGNRFLALTARGVSPSGDVSTLTGMVRGYDGRFIRSLNLKSMGMEINTEIIYKALILGARVEEIPAHLDWGPHGRARSARVTPRRIRRGILFSLFAGFIIRPFAFFIVPGLLLALVAAYIGVWIGIHVLAHYRELPAGTALDPALSEALARAFRQAPHAFIVGGIALTLSVQLFSLGVLALQVKQYFEELFHFGTRVYSQSRERTEGAQGSSRENRPSL
jgi:glycosyltransferase involved in cell wall biosynthesis